LNKKLNNCEQNVKHLHDIIDQKLHE